jgi:hypothetical protein
MMRVGSTNTRSGTHVHSHTRRWQPAQRVLGVETSLRLARQADADRLLARMEAARNAGQDFAMSDILKLRGLCQVGGTVVVGIQDFDSEKHHCLQPHSFHCCFYPCCMPIARCCYHGSIVWSHSCEVSDSRASETCKVCWVHSVAYTANTFTDAGGRRGSEAPHRGRT